MTEQSRRALVISLDGLDARYLRRRDEYGLRIPTLRRLMAAGATSLDVVTVYPSVTYPVHTSIVTGALPAHHGIVGNELFIPLGAPECGEWHWFARDIRAETLWDAARARGLSTGIVSWPVAGGAGDYNVPEIKKLGGTPRESLALMIEHARPFGIIQEVASRDPQLYAQANADEHDDMRTRFAEYLITEKRPQLMLVHLFDLDHFQHDYGPFTPEAFALLEKLDGYVARLLAATERAGTLAETDVFIVSDHGFMPISRLIHPGVLLRRAGLLSVTEERDTLEGRARLCVTDWRALPSVTGGSCAIILRDALDREALEKARGAFDGLRNGAGGEFETGGAPFSFIDAEEARALGSHPEAAFVLEAADGYAFGAGYEGDAVTRSVQRGQHGYLPSRYFTSFIASGPGITRRGELGETRIIDIGPTIARSLGLTLSDADGRALRL
ncbi:MAG TPA: ectonucleotide pyrophosphatase/phosphodiesterase [Pyrinomonadaceae bacterium]|jgi:predicted AlkP superfamily phosphohydrolase/phosphomutase|nr:ectonucleotide pyrophosphatase/phosphodiesterase [Pyrinomonadaceae bacterium]